MDPLDTRYECTPGWRAQMLIDAARRLEAKAEALRKEAAEYRNLASRINPTGLQKF